MQNQFHISGTSCCFGQEIILQSGKCARLRELEARKDVEDVIYVVGGVELCKVTRSIGLHIFIAYLKLIKLESLFDIIIRM